MTVLGDHRGVAPSELIVEDFETDRALVIGRLDRLHKGGQIQIPFARHIPEMARPVEKVHFDQGRVGKLDEENLVSGNSSDAFGVDAACQRMEAVQNQTDSVMIRPSDDLPCITVIVDMAPPGKRLEADPNTEFPGDVAQFGKIRRASVNAAQTLRMHR